MPSWRFRASLAWPWLEFAATTSRRSSRWGCWARSWWPSTSTSGTTRTWCSPPGSCSEPRPPSGIASGSALASSPCSSCQSVWPSRSLSGTWRGWRCLLRAHPLAPGSRSALVNRRLGNCALPRARWRDSHRLHVPPGLLQKAELGEPGRIEVPDKGQAWIGARDRDDAYVRLAQPALDERAGSRQVVLDPVAGRQVGEGVVHLAYQVPALHPAEPCHRVGDV